MDDLTLVTKCRDTMGFSPLVAIAHADSRGLAVLPPQYIYDPLHDDAQAMALVKRFKLPIRPPTENLPQWYVGEGYGTTYANADLNRAICECIANLKSESGE